MASQPPTVDDIVIFYYPTDTAISNQWKYGAEVLKHLQNSPVDRSLLLEEAQKRAQNNPRKFTVSHPLLTFQLPIHSHGGDSLFLDALYCYLILEVSLITEMADSKIPALCV